MATRWQSRGSRNAKAANILPILFFGGFVIMAGVAFAVSSLSSSSHQFPVPAASIRVVGSSSGYHSVLRKDAQVSHILFAKDEQRDFLVNYAFACHSQELLNRYDDLPHRYQEQLFKYCILYMGHGNVWLDDGELLVDGSELQDITSSIGIELQQGGMLHSSFLKVQTRKEPILREMMQVLLETSNHILDSSDLLLEKIMYKRVQSVKDKWMIWKLTCVDLADTSNPRFSDTVNIAPRKLHFTTNSDASLLQTSVTPLSETFGATRYCPVQGGFCCQVMDLKGESIVALQHPVHGKVDEVGDSSYFATVTRHSLDDAKGVTPQMTPNFFDILLRNDCLPTQKQCHKCLKKMGSCDDCLKECPCYCHALCHIRPPPKIIVEEWRVKLPKYKKDPSRLVPRIIHQTWYEPVTKEKYPNMSRLIESFKQSGWEYQFYDDARAVEFLSEHFPPKVLDAYESIMPGAFKADLFRYCVLLILGGVYADMDVLLESHLDELLTSDVGFMVPIDEPGSKIGHRSCLWNGLLAVAPGHPFLAKTIELVVNNVRNRFTSVDIDDMLCPNPQLSVSHSVDTLFVCGPCILGAGMNMVLGRHMQTEWEIGDVDIWSSEGGNEILVPPDDPRLQIPGRTIILNQNKEDMGAHRFTWLERNLMVAATDMPDYDDRPVEKEHYSKTHEKVGVFGLKKLYKDSKKANEAIRIVVEKA
jgi:hypothetical protein